MGNPHCSVFVGDFESMDWPALGGEIEVNQLFPNRTNIEFIRVISRSDIEVRYWERGVGKTQSSGTGSCAAVVACILNKLTDRRVRVHTLAGTLDVAWPDVGREDQPGEVTLTGPAQFIAQGTYYFRRG
jgi:diaminopimelate epimerase